MTVFIIDTVVLVRGLLDPFSRSGTLLFARTGDWDWVVSPEIVTEYLEVLQRPTLMRKYIVAENRDPDTLLDIIAAATVVEPDHVPAVCRDPADDKFLAAATAGNADLIVSEDNDLLSLATYHGVRICTVDVALRELELTGDP